MTLSSHHRLFAAHSLCFTKTTIAPHATRFPIPKPNNPFGIQRFGSFTTRNTDPFHLKARESEGTVQKHTAGSGGGFNFDSLLSAIELSCLFSSAVVSVGLAANGSSKNVLMTTVNGNSVGVGVGVLWVVLILVGGVVVRAWIRNRQWRRIRRESLKVGLVKRIEKLEEELRSSKTVVRVLSRHVEKLGKRFRVTQHDLKGPITQTAALAQKNSEVTRALSAQSEILEKELREIQKVLLAMQEQQQKQLDLILSLGNTGKLWESKLETSEKQDTLETTNSAEEFGLS